MSQVNKFKQDQNPDYIYFDLQQTNVQNTTEFIQQPLKFVETRDTPIVANSGEYHLSVTRFQLDTYNLPVLVVEPDLTQPTATYDKDQTIYKVALIPHETTITSQVTQLYIEQLLENFIITEQLGYGEQIAMTPNQEGLSIVIGRPAGNGGKGSLVFWAPPDYNPYDYTWTATNTQSMGAYGVGISADERLLITNALRTDGSGNLFGATLVWDRFKALPFGVANDPYVLETDPTLRGVSKISGDGLKIIRANYKNESLSLFTFDVNTGIFTQSGTNITSATIVELGGGGEDVGLNGVSINNDGSTLVVSNVEYSADLEGAVIIIEYDWATNTIIETFSFIGNNGDVFGHYVCMSSNGLVVAAAASGNGTPYIKIYNRTTPGGIITWTLDQTLIGGQVELGDRLSLNADGSVLFVATFATRRVKRFKKVSGTYAFDILMAVFPSRSVNVASNSTGNKAYIVNWGNGTESTEEEFLEVKTINAGNVFPLPVSIQGVPYIKPVMWKNDYKDAVAPEKNVLTGKNTALYQYYYCNAYENFIARVNVAIRTAYISMIQDLYIDWVLKFNTPSLTNVFLDYVFRQYVPPPFLEWNEAELKAELYATLLFQTIYNNQDNATNYSSNPDIAYSVVGSNRVGTIGKIAPFNFQLAMNAPLYSLFNSLPASKKVLTAPITFYRENYYIMNFFTTGNDLITPSVPLKTTPGYSFLSDYLVSGTIQYPSAFTADIAHANLLIRQPQELSTIDTWTPINAIVFTTTSLPIVVNQFSASSSIGDKPPSGSTSNEFAFIITDIQSNEQGFRPNVLYTPSAEFRRIDLTGNQPIRNIDISIFWRSTTGALIPMVLASGAQASIKLLFEKKDKTNQKEANATTLTTSIRDIV